MSFFSRFTTSFSVRGKADTLYKRGMEKAKKRDFAGAIVDYTALMETRGAPVDIQAMARLNRALAYTSTGDFDKAQEDLNALLKAPDVPATVKSSAKEKLERMRFRTPKTV